MGVHPPGDPRSLSASQRRSPGCRVARAELAAFPALRSTHRPLCRGARRGDGSSPGGRARARGPWTGTRRPCLCGDLLGRSRCALPCEDTGTVGHGRCTRKSACAPPVRAERV